MSKSGVAAEVAAAERAAGISAAKIVVDEFAEAWPDWHVWLTREGRSVVATRTGPQQLVDDDRWAKTLIADDLDTLERQLVEQREYDAVQA